MKYIEAAWTGFIVDNLNCSAEETVQFFYQKKKKGSMAFMVPIFNKFQSPSDQLKQKW